MSTPPPPPPAGPLASHPAPLARQLSLADAVFIGLGSMIGAGVFAAFAPAAASAGSALLVALAIAAAVAFCNAMSSAQLAARYPTSGGTYIYGRELLGPWWGFAAGWSFVVGKTASSAAMALTFAAYAVPTSWQKPTAMLAVIALTAIGYRGVTRTARVTRVIVVISLVTLAVVVAAGIAVVTNAPGEAASANPDLEAFQGAEPTVFGVLQASGILFFAFAGYARIATMGEEVRDPAKNIPRAIVLALALAIVVYAAVGVALLSGLGAASLATSATPLADLVQESGWQAADPLVRFGAAAAALGALLGLIAGISRTGLAMARHGDLPSWLAAVHPRFATPYRAEVVLAAVVIMVILIADLRGAIAFSSFGVLLYYFVANLAALRQPADDRRYPRIIAGLGLVLCAVLVVSLPVEGIVGGTIVVAVGLIGRGAILRLRPPRNRVGGADASGPQ